MQIRHLVCEERRWPDQASRNAETKRQYTQNTPTKEKKKYVSLEWQNKEENGVNEVCRKVGID